MVDLKQKILRYLSRTRIMQIATCVENKPWNCTVYFAFDEGLTLYWISLPDTRHSKEIAINPKISGVIVYDQQPPQETVIGISFEGSAGLLDGNQEERASAYYIKQLNREETLLSDIRSGKNPHKFYGITPKKYIVFDSSENEERQQYQIENV